jgi:hypothetical protein
MSAHIAILATPETLPLSAEAQSALGVHAGSRIAVTIEQGRVTLQPLEEDDLEQLAGSLPSSPSMADELQQERRQEKW